MKLKRLQRPFYASLAPPADSPVSQRSPLQVQIAGRRFNVRDLTDMHPVGALRVIGHAQRVIDLASRSATMTDTHEREVAQLLAAIVDDLVIAPRAVLEGLDDTQRWRLIVALHAHIKQPVTTGVNHG
jgi:hypothetical protein